jgi:hypothetical protein
MTETSGRVIGATLALVLVIRSGLAGSPSMRSGSCRPRPRLSSSSRLDTLLAERVSAIGTAEVAVRVRDQLQAEQAVGVRRRDVVVIVGDMAEESAGSDARGLDAIARAGSVNVEDAGVELWGL